MGDCNLTMKNYFHGLTTKLWSNNKQGILQILIM